MPARIRGRRTALAALIAGALLALGGLFVSHSASPALHSVADSTWGGIAPADPSPTPSPSPSEVTILSDSTWGG